MTIPVVEKTYPVIITIHNGDGSVENITANLTFEQLKEARELGASFSGDIEELFEPTESGEAN